MLHNLRINNGQATYTNQFVPSTRYHIEEVLNEECFPTLGEYTGVWGLLKVLLYPDMVREQVSNLMTILLSNTNVLMYHS